MIIRFYKYEGTGNDFVIIDNITNGYDLSGLNRELIERICDRRFGVGADGLMIMEASEEYDFEMIYFNSDGNKSTMCGNGGRCIVHLAHSLGHCDTDANFIAVDGPHRGKVGEQVSVQLKDVLSVHKTDSDYVLDTGSPHYVSFRNNISELPIIAEARKIRYSDTYSREGINVNFVEKQDGYIRLRTYERGVEDETLSCGTGVTASAIAATLEYNMEDDIVHIEAEGGKLTVKFVKEGSGFRDVWLTGPVNCVYKGEIELG